MKSCCEKCDAPTAHGCIAFTCSYGCTFCEACASDREFVCPNCSGRLQKRPEKAATMSGSCHCGAVRIAVFRNPETLTECNCSICRRYGAQWAYFTRETARIDYAPGKVGAYLWNDREIEFVHCNQCGCLTHYESVEKNTDSRIAVNFRMLPAVDVAGIPIRHFDGADSWKYLDSSD